MGYGRVLPSFMVSSDETNFHVPTIRSRISDSLCPKTNEPQTTTANRINIEFLTSRPPTLQAANPMPACHGRHTDCLPALPLGSTYARYAHHQRRNTHPIRAS